MARYTSLDPNKYIVIRQSAIDLFYENGIDETNIQQIANKAGIGKGTIYLYYRSRESLLNHIFEYCLQKHIESSMNGLDNCTSSSERLKKRTKNILLWSYHYPKESFYLSSHYRPINTVGPDDIYFSRSYEINKDIIREGIENGEFKNLPLEFMCTIFFSSVEGIAIYLRKNRQIYSETTLLDEMIETIVNGFGK